MVLRVLLAFFLFLLPAPCPFSAAGEENHQELLRKLEELTKKVEETNDLSELMKIQQKMMELMNRMVTPLPGENPGMPVGRGKTPGEEIDRQIEAINRGYRDISRTIYQIRNETGPLIPLSRASRLRGSIRVTGKDSEPPFRGWVWIDLQYEVIEEYVGYLIVIDYYDPKTGRFTEKKDYAIHSISKGVKEISQTGKQCLRASSAIPGYCTEWEAFAAHDTDKGDEYPAIHEWVVGGSSEGDQVRIEIESPSIYFWSANRRAGRALGCYGAEIKMTKSEFERALLSGTLEQWKNVGHEFRGAPHCAIGSEIKLSITFCDPRGYAEMDKCEQVKSLLASAKALIRLRNAFQEMASAASDEDHLMELVLLEMNMVYPGEDWGQKYVKESGSYNLCSQEITLPELCKGCAPRPLCEWYHKGLEIHEGTHLADAPGNPLIKNYFCDSSFVPSDLQGRQKAKIWAGLDYHAYDEQLKYYRHVLEEQLTANVECRFEPSFYADLNEVVVETGKSGSN